SADGKPGRGSAGSTAGGVHLRTGDWEYTGAEPVWAQRGHDLFHLGRGRARGWARADWTAGGEHAGVRAGWGVATGAGGSGGRVVPGRGWVGAGLSAAAGVDGRAVCAGPVQQRRGAAAVSHGRCGALHAWRRAGVSGTRGPAGEAERISD